MKTVTVTGSSPLEEVLSDGTEDVLLVRDGHAVALVVPFDDEDLEWYTRERDPAFIASIAKAREQVAQGKTMSHRELKAMFDGE
jgi:hypothetical protein